MQPAVLSTLYREKAQMMGRQMVSPTPETIAGHSSTAAIPDGWIEVNAGGFPYLTQRQTLCQSPSSLQAMLQTPERFNAHLSGDGKRLTIDQDGPTFRFVLHYLRCSRVPAGLRGQDYSMLREVARTYGVKDLTDELETYYPLREVARKHKFNNAYEHLAWTLHLCSALIAGNKIEEAHRKLDKLLLRWPLAQSQELAYFAAQQQDIQKAGLIFAFLFLHLKPCVGHIDYMKSLAHRDHIAFFTEGSEGYYFAAVGAHQIGLAFLNKVTGLLPAENVALQLQRLRIETACSQDWIHAEQAARQLMWAHAQNCALVAFLGEALLRLGRYTDAEQMLTQAMTLDHTSSLDGRTSSCLALCCLQTQRLQPALLHYLEAYRRSPDDVSVSRSLGRILSQREQHTEAEAWYRRSLQICPNDAELHNEVAKELLMQKKEAEAIAMVHAGLAFNANCVDLHRTWVAALQAIGDLNGTLGPLLRITELCPQDAQCHVQLGQMQLRLKHYWPASESFAKALLLNPHATGAATGKRRADHHVLGFAQPVRKVKSHASAATMEHTFVAVPLDGVL